MMDRLLFVCLIFSAFSMVFVNSTECKDSAITVRKVESCPHNVKEWKEAAARKGCEKMTCSSFEYHCVINAWGNETIEVCAPRLLIIGNVCSEYNIRGNRLQRNDIVPCEKCPPFYFSNESFKYQECYKYAKKAKIHFISHVKSSLIGMESTTQETIYSSSLSTINQESSHMKTIIICVVVVVFAVALVFTIKHRSWRNTIYSYLKKKVFQNEESKMTINEPEKFNVEEGREVENHLLEINAITQDVFHELNKSSDNTNLNATLS